MKMTEWSIARTISTMAPNYVRLTRTRKTLSRA